MQDQPISSDDMKEIALYLNEPPFQAKILIDI